MCDLVIHNHRITQDINSILNKLRSDISYKYLRDIQNKNNFIFVTCPFHKDGQEKKPACGINIDKDNSLPIGTYHCFACGAKGSLPQLVNKCFDKDLNDPFANDWLIDNFAADLIEYQEIIPLISEDKQTTLLDKNLLDTFEYGDTPASKYLIEKRHISKEVINYFKIGYNKENNSIVFPVWDINDNLAMITERDINSHKFYNQAGMSKPPYLLNVIIKNNYTKVAVCESQINALTCWTYNIPAIALIGTGSKEQLNILKRSGIRSFVLLFDGDLAGRHGAQRFKDALGDSALITDILLPENKDVNDLSKEEFFNLLKTS